MRYPTRGYQTRSRASNQARHEGAGLPEDDIENGPILGAESGDGTIMPLDRKIYISALGAVYFAAYARHRLVGNAPEEEFARIEAA